MHNPLTRSSTWVLMMARRPDQCRASLHSPLLLRHTSVASDSSVGVTKSLDTPRVNTSRQVVCGVSGHVRPSDGATESPRQAAFQSPHELWNRSW
jgi:hypothetical protein